MTRTLNLSVALFSLLTLVALTASARAQVPVQTVDWFTSLSGSLTGTSVTLTDVQLPQPVEVDQFPFGINTGFETAPLPTGTEMTEFSSRSDWTATFGESFEDLYVYVIGWRGDQSGLDDPPLTYEFNRPFTIISGLEDAVVNGNTLSLDDTGGAGNSGRHNGILKFSGDVSSLSVDATATFGGSHWLTFGTPTPLYWSANSLTDDSDFGDVSNWANSATDTPAGIVPNELTPIVLDSRVTGGAPSDIFDYVPIELGASETRAVRSIKIDGARYQLRPFGSPNSFLNVHGSVKLTESSGGVAGFWVDEEATLDLSPGGELGDIHIAVATNGGNIGFRQNGTVIADEIIVDVSEGLFRSGQRNFFADAGSYTLARILNVAKERASATFAGFGGAVNADITERIIVDGELALLQNATVTAPIIEVGETGRLVGGKFAASQTDLDPAVIADVENSGTLAPGRSFFYLGGPSPFLIFGDYSQTSTGEYEVHLEGTELDDFDNVSVTGDVDLAGSLNVILDDFVLAPGMSFQILSIDGSRSGIFDGLGQDSVVLVDAVSNLELFIDYAAGDGNDIALYTVIPEPSTLLLGILSLGLLSFRTHARMTNNSLLVAVMLLLMSPSVHGQTGSGIIDGFFVDDVTTVEPPIIIPEGADLPFASINSGRNRYQWGVNNLPSRVFLDGIETPIEDIRALGLSPEERAARVTEEYTASSNSLTFNPEFLFVTPQHTPFLAGTLFFTNGQSAIGSSPPSVTLNINTESFDPGFTQSIDLQLGLVSTPNLIEVDGDLVIASDEQAADFIYFIDRPELGSFRVFEGETTSVEIFLEFGSLNLVGFGAVANPTAGFLSPSVNIPEPSAMTLGLFAAITALAQRKKRPPHPLAGRSL